MRPEYTEWLQREDFKALTRNSYIVHAHICADAPVIDLVLALAEAHDRLLKSYVDLKACTALPPVFQFPAKGV
jgi:hypothetical protein